jgi:HEAT repeat protein
LSDEQSLVREWSVSGLAALGEEAAPVLPALVPLLDDSSVSVRIEAAHLIARLDTGAARAKALRLLAAHLDSDAPWVAPRAARALELLGEISRPTITAMQSALRERGAGFQGTPKGPRPVHLSLEFSLRSALKALEKPTQTE